MRTAAPSQTVHHIDGNEHEDVVADAPAGLKQAECIVSGFVDKIGQERHQSEKPNVPPSLHGREGFPSDYIGESDVSWRIQ